MECNGRYLNSSPKVLSAAWWGRLWRAIPKPKVQRVARRLRVCESVSLGEKRLIAVVQYDNQKFLVGGGGQSVGLLARLGNSQDFGELLSEWCERQR